MSALDAVNLAHKIAPEVLRDVIEKRRNSSKKFWLATVNLAAGFSAADMSEDEQIGLVFGRRLYVIEHSAGQAFGRAEAEMERERQRRKGAAA